MAEAISAVRQAIEAGGWIPAGATVVAAVSGGVDSMVMLDVLARLAPKKRWRLVVAHVDHGLREGSGADATFVAGEAARRGLEVAIGTPDVRGRARREKGGIAAVARAARYEFLREVARREKAAVVATAHTASDQAETILLRVLRGTGARGLAGIPTHRRLEKGIEVVRPLLAVTRTDVLAHAQRFGLVWREDPSNLNVARTRNRVRHELLPLMQAIAPDAARALARAASQAADAARIVATATRRASRRVIRERGKGRVVLDRARWMALPPELGALVLRTAIAEVRGDAGTRAAHVVSVAAAFRRGRGRVIFEGAEAAATPGSLEIRARRHVESGAGRRRLKN